MKCSLAMAIAVAMMALLVVVPAGCEPGDPDARTARPAGEGGWLRGSSHEKFDTIADQLRGFDHAMMEVGERFQGLYWAGRDRNWEFARYHLDKMRLALELGFEREPARERSADAFMTVALPRMEEAVVRRDPAMFADRFAELIVQCNACHAMEDVQFINVREPQVRVQPWYGRLDEEAEQGDPADSPTPPGLP